MYTITNENNPFENEEIKVESEREVVEAILDKADYEIEEEYKDSLDFEGTVTICGYEYYPSAIFENVDPIAYRCGLADYRGTVVWDNVTHEVEQMEEGDEAEFYGWTVTKEETEEEAAEA